VLPAGHSLAAGDVVEAYRWFGEVWVDATHALGAESRIVSIAEARDRAGQPTEINALQLACFGTLSPYEVAVGSRKLVGLAQVRRRNGVLLQSAIHLHFDAATLARLVEPESMEQLAAALRSAAVGLHDVAPDEPSAGRVMEAFRICLLAKMGIGLHMGDWTPAETWHVTHHQPWLDWAASTS
jgi:lipoate-protein ligase A